MFAAAQIAVDGKPLTPQLTRFAPAPARCVVLGRLIVSTPQNWDLAFDDLLHLSGQFVARDEDGDLRPDPCRRDVASG
jgi:hypothetical protein